MTSPVGNRRTFFQSLYRHLPDQLSAIAGPFWKERSRIMARTSRKMTAACCPTKRLSKHCCLEAKEGSGLRPACRKECFGSRHGSTERSVSNRPTQEKGDCRRQRRSAVGSRVPPRGRRAIAVGGERGSEAGDQRSTLNTAWESRKPATLQGQSVAGYRRDRRAVDGWHSFLVTDARGTPPVAADYRQSATPRPHHAGPTA